MTTGLGDVEDMRAMNGVMNTSSESKYHRSPALLESVIILAVIAVQLWVFLAVPTVLKYDIFEYIASGRKATFCHPLPSGDSIHRNLGFPLYPIVLRLLSFNYTHFNLLFLFQSALFVIALIVFTRTFITDIRLRWLIYIPALVPAFAWMQKLLFPDGMLLSLILIYLALLSKKYFKLSLAMAVVIFGIKTIFVFLIPLAILFWKIDYIARIRLRYKVGGLVILYSLAILFLYRYMTFYPYSIISLRPLKNKYEFRSYVPDKEISINNPFRRRILRLWDLEDSMSEEVMVLTEKCAPFSPQLKAKYPCSDKDIARIQKDTIAILIRHRPLLPLKLAVKIFVLTFTGQFTDGDLYLFLDQATSILNDGALITKLYDDTTLRLFSKCNVQPRNIPAFTLLKHHKTAYTCLLRPYEFVMLFMLALSLIVAIRRRILVRLISDPSSKLLLYFLLIYASLVTLTIYNTCDRHTNLVIPIFAAFSIRIFCQATRPPEDRGHVY